MTSAATARIVEVLRQAAQHDAAAQALRRDAGRLLVYATPLQRKEISRLTGVSTGTLDLLAGTRI
jgi:hypothetical protein